MLAMFGCGASSVTSNSRMCWSFSRDGGLPFGRYLSAVNKTYLTPLAFSWLVESIHRSDMDGWQVISSFHLCN